MKTHHYEENNISSGVAYAHWNDRKGSHSPIAPNTTEEGRAKNRRVEFVKK